MNNPFQQMQQRVNGNQMAQGFSQAAGMFQAMQNPVATMFGQAMQNIDPRLQEVYKYALKFGGNFEQAFYALAKEKGRDAQEVLSEARKYLSRQKW